MVAGDKKAEYATTFQTVNCWDYSKILEVNRRAIFIISSNNVMSETIEHLNSVRISSIPREYRLQQRL